MSERPTSTPGTHLPFVLVTLGVALGLVTAAMGRPIRGCALVGGSFLAAGFMRSVLSTRSVGMLANRGRMFDSVIFSGLGVVILGLIVSLRTTYKG